MIKKNLGMGMLVAVLAFGMMVVGCGDSRLRGTTWGGFDGATLTFSNNGTGFTLSSRTDGGSFIIRTGNYSVSGDNIELRFSDGNTMSAWFSNERTILTGRGPRDMWQRR